MHQRDRRTDRLTDEQTPGDSKDRAYVLRRAVKILRSRKIRCLLRIPLIEKTE